MNGNGSVKNSGRKCLSRAQMAEPYELSQDLLDRQVEALSNKYGGGLLPHNAANTIQRAYRRYTMDKKFKAITSSRNKTENRLSRRFASIVNAGNCSADAVDAISLCKNNVITQRDQIIAESVNNQAEVANLRTCTSIHGECCALNNVVYSQGNSRNATGITSTSSLPSESDGSYSKSNTLEEYQLHHQKLQMHYQQQIHAQRKQLQHHHQMQLQQQMIQQHIQSEQSSKIMCISGINHHTGNSSNCAVGLAQHECLNYNCTVSNSQWIQQQGNGLHQKIGKKINKMEEFETNLDSSQISNENVTSQQSSRSMLNRSANWYTRANGAKPGHHSHCINCALVHQEQRSICSRKRAPEVPKRTVSRLTSLDIEESSELYPARANETRCSGSSNHRSCAEQLALQICSPRGPQEGLTVNQQPLDMRSRENCTGIDLANQILLSNNSSTNRAAIQKQELNRSLTSAPTRDLNRNLHSSGTNKGDSSFNEFSSRSTPTCKDSLFNNTSYTVNEVIRKRHYRTGLNIFNKKPEKGISYLIAKGFLDNSPAAVARFLITRKGLSKQMIGDYLGNISNPFNMAVLNAFSNEIDISNSYIDVALRKFQTYFRMPGEAQKIERLTEVFSQRYCVCNPSVVSQLNSVDTVFILAFAIILLNTDLHTPNLKPEKRMKAEDFIRNLRGIDSGADPDPEMLNGVYERIKTQEFKPGSDHVTQVMKVQQTIVVKCPNLAVPYRRLVCYCRLYEVQDINKKDKPGQHQREVFLFNDILVITKIYSRRKNSVTYAFRNQFPLTGMIVSLFENSFHSHGITLTQRWDKKVVITLNARNDHDRSKFVEDLRESIAEMDEMEALRIEAELEKQHATSRVTVSSTSTGTVTTASSQNRDSGVNDCESQDSSLRIRGSADSGNLKRSALNNSLLDLSENHIPAVFTGINMRDKPVRRGSVGSLDSGMSVSFQSGSAGSAGTVSQESSPQQQMQNTRGHQQHTQHASRARKLSANMSTNL